MQRSRALRVAERLAAEFLNNGNFEAARGSLDIRTMTDILPVAAEFDVRLLPEYGFAGLSIQAVGYSYGADEEAVHIYVTKGNRSRLKKLSQEVDGVQVIVSNLGRLIVRPEATVAAGNRGNIYEVDGRIACGSSCAPAGETYAGTFGALVTGADGQMMALSNNHVFAACNHIPVGQPILSPSAVDARPELPSPRQICRHARIVELRSGTPSLVPLARCDAAVATIPDEDIVSSWQGDKATGYDTPAKTIPPYAGLRVKKTGRTSGQTFGTVDALTQPWPLPYKNSHFPPRFGLQMFGQSGQTRMTFSHCQGIPGAWS